MARVQLVMPAEDRERFAYQARREGMTLSAWLRAAARERLEGRQGAEPFAAAEDLEAFFRECDGLEGPAREPDWEEHLAVMAASRARGASGT